MRDVGHTACHALLLFALCAVLPAVDPASAMSADTFTAKDGLALPYRVWQAPVADGQRLPLVLFLHGSGGRGDDNRKQLRDGLPLLLSAVMDRHPCILVAPQCPGDIKWTGVVWQDSPLTARTLEPTRAAAAVLDLIAHLSEQLPVDHTRILLTGVSMGGSGTWDLATRAPDLFAAIMPICGGCDAREAARYTDQTIWAFQGARDDVVKPDLPRLLIAALRDRGIRPRYTEFPEAGHDIAKRVYGDAETVQWLLDQQRRVK